MTRGRKRLIADQATQDTFDRLRDNASHIINRAIADGTVKRKPCAVCKSSNSHAHHDDYSRPLEVRFLCPKHHFEWHTRNGRAQYILTSIRKKSSREKNEKIVRTINPARVLLGGGTLFIRNVELRDKRILRNMATDLGYKNVSEIIRATIKRLVSGGSVENL